MSYQPQTFINFDSIQPMENIKNGFCSIAAFIQGFSKAQDVRLTEQGLREKISDIIRFMVDNSHQVRNV